ncbi:CGNR zinc finger domain-containing protein [Kutzneria viridogrisea]|uniref:Zinc finger CGNR domain-containing protein n=2 Tax=Kutzneria TaxID=43356 RepID=W5WKA3_9PSEU|nr:ABATE domain-containing protein [Kutzneria albida]AHI01293.1 hypothetical protein KALB_7935 [Kutzneria albida DSM 43870]MBA8926546.1 putative RNA-binding Zn ribbon-like protein [Kutzneria viridogrisea]
MTFPLIGEPLALDLVNTRPHTADGPVDLLATASGLHAWLAAQSERIDEPELTVTKAVLEAVHHVRQHTVEAVRAARLGQCPPTGALHALTAAQLAAPAYEELRWDGSVTTVRKRTGSPAERLAAGLACAATELLVSPAITSVRECEAADCVLLFLPAHPRRRWCSAARCGNRARVARYYQRHKP